MSNVNYEAMKAEYTSAPYNIPEKLYAYYKANGTYSSEAISLRDVFVESLLRNSFNTQKIPQGKDNTVYRELMDLLQGFAEDHNYSLAEKRRLLYEIADSIPSRLPSFWEGGKRGRKTRRRNRRRSNRKSRRHH